MVGLREFNPMEFNEVQSEAANLAIASKFVLHQ
jgi:hypothetical protein